MIADIRGFHSVWMYYPHTTANQRTYSKDRISAAIRLICKLASFTEHYRSHKPQEDAMDVQGADRAPPGFQAAFAGAARLGQTDSRESVQVVAAQQAHAAQRGQGVFQKLDEPGRRAQVRACQQRHAGRPVGRWAGRVRTGLRALHHRARDVQQQGRETDAKLLEVLPGNAQEVSVADGMRCNDYRPVTPGDSLTH